MSQRQFKKLSDDEVVADWVRWIERAYKEAIGQAWRHKMFRLLRGIYQQNSDLQNTGAFFVMWAADNYVTATAIALRRELDTQRGTENLFHMLVEMRHRPEALSRARFRSTWKSTLTEYTADRAFEIHRIVKHPDTADSDHIDPAMMAEDLGKLAAVENVLIHIQTRIAHRAPDRPGAAVPTFDEFHGAVETVGEVFERYYLLLTHRTLLTREPSEQFNIYAPFRFAWMPDPENFDYERCK